jgi:hypothetical protein
MEMRIVFSGTKFAIGRLLLPQSKTDPCPPFYWVHANFLVSLIKTKNAGLPAVVCLVVGLAVTDCDVSWHSTRADDIPRINARVVAVGIPGASAISQVGTFLNDVAKAPVRPRFPNCFLPKSSPAQCRQLDDRQMCYGTSQKSN